MLSTAFYYQLKVTVIKLLTRLLSIDSPFINDGFYKLFPTVSLSVSTHIIREPMKSNEEIQRDTDTDNDHLLNATITLCVTERYDSLSLFLPGEGRHFMVFSSSFLTLLQQSESDEHEKREERQKGKRAAYRMTTRQRTNKKTPQLSVSHQRTQCGCGCFVCHRLRTKCHVSVCESG